MSPWPWITVMFMVTAALLATTRPPAATSSAAEVILPVEWPIKQVVYVVPPELPDRNPLR